MADQGSFKLLRSFLGTIAGGLSSLASIPFVKRKQPEDPLLIEAPPDPHTGLDQTGDNLSKLYPDMELSETRKRARLSLDADKGECSKKNVKDLGETSEDVNLGSSEDLDGCDITPIRLDDVSCGADETLGDSDATAFCSDDVSHDANMSACKPDDVDGSLHDVVETLHIPHGSDEKGISQHDEILHDFGEDFDQNLASFKTILLARKTKAQKRGQDSLLENTPRKKVRFGNPALGCPSDNESAHMLSIDTVLKKCTPGLKRKRVDVVGDKNEKKLRALTLTEEPIRAKGKVSTVGMVRVSTRKRERMNDNSAPVKALDGEMMKLRNVVFIENLPLNASRKAISKEFSQFGAMESIHLQSVFFQEGKMRRKPIISGELNKTPNSQNARIVYKDELSANAALALNMKEFNGNCIRVFAAGAHGGLKETASTLEDTWSIFVSNTPTDVKDEELYHLFGNEGSLKLDVKSVRVTRDPHSGLSKGTAYVFFKTKDDVNRLLLSRHTLKLRDRVLRVSPVSVNTQVEQRFTPPRLAKGSINSEADESSLQEKRVKLSSPHEGVTTTKEFAHQGKQTITRSKQSDLSTEDHIEVHISSSHAYTTRQVAASRGQSESLEGSPEAKRKRAEKHQRGISRSKKIRRT